MVMPNIVTLVFQLFKASRYNEKYKLLFIYFSSSLLIAFLELIGLATIVSLLSQFLGENTFVDFYFFKLKSKLLATVVIILIWILRALIMSFCYRFNYQYVQSIKSGLQLAQLDAAFSSENRSDEKEAGRLFASLTNEVQMITGQIFIPITNAFSELLLISSLLFITFLASPKAILLALLFFGVAYIAMQKYVSPYTQRLGKERLSTEKSWSESVVNLFNLRHEAKVYKVEQIVKDNLVSKLRKSNIASGAFLSLNPSIRTCLEALFITVLFIILYVTTSTGISSPEKLLFVFLALLRILPSINRLSLAYQSLKFAEPVAQKQLKILGSLTTRDKYNVNPGIGYSVSILNSTLLCTATGTIQPSSLSIDLYKCKGLYCMTGESGLGKTSLLNQISSILQKNSFSFNGRLLSISYATQGSCVIQDNVSTNLDFYRKLTTSDLEYGIQLLKAWGFNDKKFASDINCVDFSGGEKKRLSLARAFVGAPNIILLDEPTSGLDSYTASSVIQSIHAVSKFSLVIVVTHDDHLASLADHLYTMTS